MASAKELKKRISTVKNTQQTTKAMKMVSAAKLRKAQMGIVAQRPYAQKVRDMMKLVSLAPDVQVDSPLVSQEGLSPKDKTVLLLIITSDRGLCGSFNSSICKEAENWIGENKSNFKEIKLAFVGRRGRDYFVRRGYKAEYYSEFGPKVHFFQAEALLGDLVQKLNEGSFNEVIAVFNHFRNAITQEVTLETLLPIHGSDLDEVVQSGSDTPGAEQFLMKPSPQGLMERLLEKHFAVQAYRYLLESQASEHGARMSAMDNATRNAGDMIDSLTLQYNKQRQTAITTEMLEIISGSESQKQ